jgi:hypothetical protein
MIPEGICDGKYPREVVMLAILKILYIEDPTKKQIADALHEAACEHLKDSLPAIVEELNRRAEPGEKYSLSPDGEVVHRIKGDA